jgi:hypothetical protein
MLADNESFSASINGAVIPQTVNIDMTPLEGIDIKSDL